MTAHQNIQDLATVAYLDGSSYYAIPDTADVEHVYDALADL